MKRGARGVVFAVIAAAGLVAALIFSGILPERYYSAEHFGIEVLKSENDADNDRIDDYTDILLSAREYMKTDPDYKSAYYSGGYPPDGEGVCTDVIWKALKGAGYDLKAAVDKDIAEHPERYDIEKPDGNIDFRRVRNLLPFFEAHAESLTLDTSEIAEWQGGDIVVFTGHIAIVSDRRNRQGIPFIIHNANPYQLRHEENALAQRDDIVGHFRIKEGF